MTGRSYLAAFVLAATALSGCSLVEQVIIMEPRKSGNGAVSSAAPSRSASVTAARCSPANPSGPGCSAKTPPKAYSASYDSGPVLKPVEKAPDKKPPEAAESSAFVSAVKSWIKTGMHLHGWAGPQ